MIYEHTGVTNENVVRKKVSGLCTSNRILTEISLQAYKTHFK